jgi:phosphoglycerol transferase MdoB-like AlkP superfamily enzyme
MLELDAARAVDRPLHLETTTAMTTSPPPVGKVPALLVRRLTWVFATAAAFLLAVYTSRYEGSAAHVLFSLLVASTIGAVIVLLARRVLVALVLVTALLGVVVAVSIQKQQTMNMVLHAYDLFFYPTSWSTLAFLWHSYRFYVVALLIAFLVTGLAVWLACRIDDTRVERRSAALAAVVFASFAWVAAQAKSDRNDAQFFFDDLYVSSFFSSWSETLETLWRGMLITAADTGDGRKLAPASACKPTRTPPNIILIHHESAVPPALFSGLDYDRRLDTFFHSEDKKLHKLRVETFGGASWLTEFSVLTGLSTYHFGGMRPFVQPVMAGKLHDTLPQMLELCGYRNVLVYPMLRNFVSNGRFYDSIGITSVLDAEAQGAIAPNERDEFYYRSALDEMAEHFAVSASPLFLYVQTQSTHGSYDFVYKPEVNVPGGGPGTDPEVSEYLRRLALSEVDYRFLKAELARRFPDRSFIIVRYGDHQPDIARRLLGPPEEASRLIRTKGSPAFLTYYAMETQNFRASPLPGLDVVDVPYLGTIIMEAARLPLPDSYRERKRLMALCKGHYDGCARDGEILAFHRRLIDSGLMDPM